MYAFSKALYNEHYYYPSLSQALWHSLVRGATSSHLNSLGSIQATRLPLGVVNLFGMHIIPPVTVTAGTHFTYPQRVGELSQPPARLSQESAGTEPETSCMKVHCSTTWAILADNTTCTYLTAHTTYVHKLLVFWLREFFDSTDKLSPCLKQHDFIRSERQCYIYNTYTYPLW